MNFLKVCENVNTEPLLQKLLANPDLWNKNPCRLSKRGPHYETQDIFLRYKDETENLQNASWSNFGDPHLAEWYKAIEYLPESKPLIFDLMRLAQGEILGGVFIYKVEPGKQIYSHIDTGWHAEYFDKFNICLQSNEKAAFVYENERMVQKAGDIHLFRNDVNHWVVNEGETDHIVLVVC